MKISNHRIQNLMILQEIHHLFKKVNILQFVNKISLEIPIG